MAEASCHTCHTGAGVHPQVFSKDEKLSLWKIKAFCSGFGVGGYLPQVYPGGIIYSD